MPSAHIDIRPPKRFNTGTVLGLTIYGLAVALPVLVAALAVSVMSRGVWTILFPLCAVALATLFLPFGFGNPLITRLVRNLPREKTPGVNEFIVQLTFIPRLRSGLRALLEDADDVGWLAVSDSGVIFQGDSVDLTLPGSQIREVRLRSSGWRGLFAYGARITLQVSELPNVRTIQFAERSSWLLPASRRTAYDIFQAVQRVLPPPGRVSENPAKPVM